MHIMNNSIFLKTVTSLKCRTCKRNEISILRKHVRILYGFSQGCWYHTGPMMAWLKGGSWYPKRRLIVLRRTVLYSNSFTHTHTHTHTHTYIYITKLVREKCQHYIKKTFFKRVHCSSGTACDCAERAGLDNESSNRMSPSARLSHWTQAINVKKQCDCDVRPSIIQSHNHITQIIWKDQRFVW